MTDSPSSNERVAPDADCNGSACTILRQMRSEKANAPLADAELGIAWWNHLTETERADWMKRAGNTGVAADAWTAFKTSESESAPC